MAIRKNYLTQAQCYQLCSYLKPKKAEIAESRVTMKKEAAKATRELGFKVTNKNVMTCAEIVGVHFTSHGSVSSRGAIIRNFQIAELLIDLCKEFGFDHPQVEDIKEKLRARAGLKPGNNNSDLFENGDDGQ